MKTIMVHSNAEAMTTARMIKREERASNIVETSHDCQCGESYCVSVQDEEQNEVAKVVSCDFCADETDYELFI